MRKNRNQSIQLLYGYNFIKVNEDYFIALLSKKNSILSHDTFFVYFLWYK